jgi:hypothetical protein
MLLNEAMDAVLSELKSATEKHGKFPTAHHGYAVLLEELDEMWHEVKHGTKERAREEAIQVAAMAIRYCMDIC